MLAAGRSSRRSSGRPYGEAAWRSRAGLHAHLEEDERAAEHEVRRRPQPEDLAREHVDARSQPVRLRRAAHAHVQREEVAERHARRVARLRDARRLEHAARLELLQRRRLVEVERRARLVRLDAADEVAVRPVERADERLHLVAELDGDRPLRRVDAREEGASERVGRAAQQLRRHNEAHKKSDDPGRGFTGARRS